MKTLIISKLIGQRIKLDNDTYNEIKDFDLIISNDKIIIQFENHQQLLKNYIMKIENKNKNYAKFKNDIFDFQRDNLYIVTASSVRDQKPQSYDVEYKGVATHNRKDRYTKYYIAVKNYKSNKVYLKCNSVYESAQKYNAICDLIGVAGYRNDVEKYELSQDEKEKVKKKLEL